MDELSDDLLLLAARADGRLPILEKLRFGLAGAELVRLAAAGRVNVVHGRIEVIHNLSTGDPLLDEALASMGASRGLAGRGPTAKAWVARHRPELVKRYLARAEMAGIIRAERRKALGFIPVTRWIVVDTARAAQARARLEAVAASTGPVDSAQAALAGLATAIGVAGLVFPGMVGTAGAAARKRLRQAAKGDAASEATARAARDDTASAVNDATRAATDAAVSAATNAAISAATDAAVQASIDAATQAAVSAAHSASHSASHGGAAGGHH